MCVYLCQKTKSKHSYRVRFAFCPASLISFRSFAHFFLCTFYRTWFIMELNAKTIHCDTAFVLRPHIFNVYVLHFIWSVESAARIHAHVPHETCAKTKRNINNNNGCAIMIQAELICLFVIAKV